MKKEKSFQSEFETIKWNLHFASSTEKVYNSLSTNEGRKGYWAESADEKNGKIHYKFLNNIEDKGEVLEKLPNRRFSVMYFGWKVIFNINEDGLGGTDLEMISTGVGEAIKMEIVAGWVSWLMAMKASVDFGVDLRNHDEKRTWFSGYVDN